MDGRNMFMCRGSSKSIRIFALTLSCIVFVAGCGDPDLQAMKPQVVKPSAEVILVNHPSGWNANEIAQTGSQQGVDVNVVNDETNTQILKQIQSLLHVPNIGIILVDNSTNVSTLLTNLPNYAANMHIDIIAPAETNVSQNAYRFIYMDPLATSYCVGWLAGALANQNGQHQVGWITNGSISVSKLQMELSVAGAYQANPSLSPIPVSIQTNISGAILPHILIATRPLSAVDWQIINQSGSIVVSLVQTSSSVNLAANPAFVQNSVLDSEFALFANANWHPGHQMVDQIPFLQMNSALVSSSIWTQEQAVEANVLNQVSSLQNAWTMLPTSLQNLALPIVQVGQ